jgi:hypothetical protein
LRCALSSKFSGNQAGRLEKKQAQADFKQLVGGVENFYPPAATDRHCAICGQRKTQAIEDRDFSGHASIGPARLGGRVSAHHSPEIAAARAMSQIAWRPNSPIERVEHGMSPRPSLGGSATARHANGTACGHAHDVAFFSGRLL